jgi:antitoxin MazE
MPTSKCCNSLAVRLPAVVVEALDLKEGDEIEISIAGRRDFKVGLACGFNLHSVDQ